MNVSRETSFENYFDLSEVWFASIFKSLSSPWEALVPGWKEEKISALIKPNISSILRKSDLVTERQTIPCEGGESSIEAGAFIIGDEIELQAGVSIEAGAWVTGPTILGPKTSVRNGAYIRGGVITGESTVIGHCSEVKSSILFNGAKAAHFAYVGDSILGANVNLGAGTKISNLKMTNDEVVLNIDGKRIPSGLRKMGAIIGDGTETGCNSVLNPGALLSKSCLVYPTASVRNKYYKAKSRIK